MVASPEQPDQTPIKTSDQSEPDCGEKDLFLYRSVFHDSAEAMVLVRKEIVDCNAKAVEMWGGTRELILGRPLTDFAPSFQPDGRNSKEAAAERLEAARSGESPFFFWQAMALDGRLVDTEAVMTLLPGASGESPVLLTMRRVTDALRLSAELAKAQMEYRKLYQTARRDERLIKSLLAVSGDPILIFDASEKVRFANEAFVRLFGWSLEEIVDREIDFVPDEEVGAGEELWQRLESGRSVVGLETKRLTKKGEEIPVSISAASVVNENGERAETLFILRDITVQKRAAEALTQAYEMQKELADRDSLTGLFNHRRLHQELSRELERARRKGEFLSLIMMDLDEFKSLNDTHGHVAGDVALRSMANVLESSCRPGDVVGRYGGDEFLIILPGAGRGGVRGVARRILAEVANRTIETGGGAEIGLRASMGLATFPLDTASRAKLVSLADQAMYRAKESSEAVALPPNAELDLDLERPHNFEEAWPLIEALDQRLPRSAQHSREVATQSVRLARAIGLHGHEVDQIGRAAFLHNLGKVWISESIMTQAKPLKAKDEERYKCYPLFGRAVLQGLDGLEEAAAQAVLDHQEWWDGNGYPQGLRGEEISLWGRILAVADLTSSSVLHRPYRDAVLEKEEVRRSLLNASGARLDPDLVKSYLEILDGD